MKLSDYFEKTKGRGVISTADSSGHLTSAVYAKPHFMDENNIAFIMADRLTHKNLESNTNAVYLFMESGEKYAETSILPKLKRKEQPSD
jgi:hypothetical protein